MRALVSRMLRSNFLRSLTVLTSGVVIAQMIPLLMLPIYARLFDASIFALQALLLLGFGFLVPIATGFYEWAVPIPRQKRQAHTLATFVVCLSLSVVLLVLGIITLFHDPLAKALNLTALGNWMLAYPLIIFCGAMCNLSNYWMLRQGKYALQSWNRIVLSASTAMVTLGCGLSGMEHGLLVGFVGGFSIGAAFALMQAWRQGLRLRFDLTQSYLAKFLRKYSEFPLYGSLPSSINNLAVQVPLIIITATYTLDATGHYAVARNLLSGGAAILSACIGQLVLKQIADLAQRNERVWPYYIRLVGVVFVLGLLLAAGVYVLGPWFFHLYLGDAWVDSAKLTRTLSFCLVFWLVGPALALAPIALRKLKSVALWQVIYGLLACSLFFVRDLPFDAFIRYVVMLEIFAYALYAFIVSVTMWRFDRTQRTA